MKKRLIGMTVAAALAALTFGAPAWAQDTTGTGSGTSGTTTDAGDNRDEGFDLGWLGLLGLAGLAGLRKPAPTVVHRDSSVRP